MPRRTLATVLGHGDCAPPKVLPQGGRVVGYVDVGEVGLADRWRDVALATWGVT